MMKESAYNIWLDRATNHYVFNSLSGALLRVAPADLAVFHSFLSGEATEYSVNQLLPFVKGGMLIGEDTDELALLEKRYASTRHDTSRFALTIVTSLGCNFDCPYCFESKHHSLLAEDVQRAILEMVRWKLPRIESFFVTWFGGEPLLGKKALLSLSRAFIELCADAGVAYGASIVTNGYLLDEETCLQLRECRVGQVQVSLDGPPEVHDKMRPLANGGSSFGRILRNLHNAVQHFEVSVRVNVDVENFPRAEEVLQILAAEGFAGKLTVDVGQIVRIDGGNASPSTSYTPRCFNRRDFAEAEMRYMASAVRYGFGKPELPRAVGTPCTAVRANELVVGSEGELYKCWDSVGNRNEVIGNVRDWHDTNSRLSKWLTYDPFSDPDCRVCVALPVCMGGCAHHALDPLLRENRCDTFRHVHQERVLTFVKAAEGWDPD